MHYLAYVHRSRKKMKRHSENFRYFIVSYLPRKLSIESQVFYYKFIGILGYLLRRNHRIISLEEISIQNLGLLWRVNCTDGSIYIPNTTRISRFIWGIDHALNRLSAQYSSKSEDIMENTIVVDGGANIGEFSYWALRNGAAGAIVIDPDDKNIYCARLNLERYEQKVTYLNRALSDSEGVSQFYFSQDSANSSMYGNSSKDEIQEIRNIETTTLDNIFVNCLRNREYILKLDAEGHEPEVVKGAYQFLLHCDRYFIDVSAERYLESTQMEVEKLLTSYSLKYKVVTTQNSRIIIHKNV